MNEATNNPTNRIVFTTKLPEEQKQNVVDYLRKLIEIVKEYRVINAEIKVTNETVRVPERGVTNHVPTGIKVVDLMIRFA